MSGYTILIRNFNRYPVCTAGIGVVCTPVKPTTVFGIHSNYHITIGASGAFIDISFNGAVVGHEVADFRFVGTDVEGNAIVLIVFVL